MTTSAVRIAVFGIGTGVGKTTVVKALAHGLRALGERVWLHKPMACGEWQADNHSSADGRSLRVCCADGQDPATVCPREYPEPCSPHLAAQLAEGRAPSLDALLAAIPQPPPGTALMIEGAGGIATPLTCDRADNAAFAAAAGLPVVLVVRPELGCLSHTVAACSHARARGATVVGLIVNALSWHTDPRCADPRCATPHFAEPRFAERTAARELATLTGLPVLAELSFAPGPRHQRALAAALRACLGT